MGFRGVLLGWRSSQCVRLLKLMRRCRALLFVFLVYSYSSLIRVDIVGWIGYLSWLESGWTLTLTNNYWNLLPLWLLIFFESRIGLTSVL
jgi:hypothetical protein